MRGTAHVRVMHEMVQELADDQRWQCLRIGRIRVHVPRTFGTQSCVCVDWATGRERDARARRATQRVQCTMRHTRAMFDDDMSGMFMLYRVPLC
jgi:hypothetical protein